MLRVDSLWQPKLRSNVLADTGTQYYPTTFEVTHALETLLTLTA